MSDQRQNKSLFLCGNVTLDIYAHAPAVEKLTDSKHFATGGTGVALGGAPCNVARAIKTLSAAYGDDYSTSIITQLGQPPAENQFNDFGEYVLADHSYQMLHKLLEKEGLDVFDVAVDGSSYALSTNIVANFKDGRSILKQSHQGTNLTNGFNAVHNGMAFHTHAEMQNSLNSASYAFIDPSTPEIALVAIAVCEKKGVPVIVDYGGKVWPSDPNKAKELRDILTRADILIVPGDAVVEGMEDNVKDADLLFETLQGGGYKASTIILSDGTDVVQVCHDGKLSKVLVTPAEGALYLNGAGDTRDGALVFFLGRGDDVLEAVKKATTMASIKIQYSKNEWGQHICEHVKDNALFAGDLPDLEAHKAPLVNTSPLDLSDDEPR